MDSKISIITCTYNSEEYLLKNIKSVCEQKYTNWEHIFVDGFSNDNTISIIKEYQSWFSGKVKIFQLKPKGISNAMNEGIRRSSGDYLIHLHSDDSFYDKKVLTDVSDFVRGNDFDWLYGKINVVETNGASVGIFPKKWLWKQNNKCRWGRYLLKFYNFIPHQAVFIKKEIFEKYGYFDEALESAMDPDLWLRIKDKTKWGFYDRIISNYCLRSASQSANLNKKETNKINYARVQSAHLGRWEMKFAGILNRIIEKKNKNFR
jgi:glycosyltransferase involved in cell wall biosynthesis